MIGSLFLHIVMQNTLCSLPMNTMPRSPENLMGMRPEGWPIRCYSVRQQLSWDLNPELGMIILQIHVFFSFLSEFLFSRVLHVAWNQLTVFLLPHFQSYRGPPQNFSLWVISAEHLFLVMIFLSNLQIDLIQILTVVVILLYQ